MQNLQLGIHRISWFSFYLYAAYICMILFFSFFGKHFLIHNLI